MKNSWRGWRTRRSKDLHKGRSTTPPPCSFWRATSCNTITRKRRWLRYRNIIWRQLCYWWHSTEIKDGSTSGLSHKQHVWQTSWASSQDSTIFRNLNTIIYTLVGLPIQRYTVARREAANKNYHFESGCSLPYWSITCKRKELGQWTLERHLNYFFLYGIEKV